MNSWLISGVPEFRHNSLNVIREVEPDLQYAQGLYQQWNLLGADVSELERGGNTR